MVVMGCDHLSACQLLWISAVDVPRWHSVSRGEVQCRHISVWYILYRYCQLMFNKSANLSSLSLSLFLCLFNIGLPRVKSVKDSDCRTSRLMTAKLSHFSWWLKICSLRHVFLACWLKFLWKRWYGTIELSHTAQIVHTHLLPVPHH